ncbi:retrovirus-related pol polyprotein from transposon TNT 1-94 [Tanacetum coccineum]
MNDRSCETYNAKDVTALIEQNECVRVELEKVKHHYKELYDSIKITRAHTSENSSTMLNEIKSLKPQLKSKVSCVTSVSVQPKVLLRLGMHLEEIIETVREIELLEYVIGTCPKSFNERVNKDPSTPLTRKKQVTFNVKPGTSPSNTQKHEEHQKVQHSNIHMIPSIGVKSSTEASGSKPRSNTKNNRYLPAMSVNQKTVEDHPRTNKSVWTKVNRVYSSISSKRVVINSNSESVCKMYNKCLISVNHDTCVLKSLNSVNATPTVKIILNKGKQIWKPKGKLSDNSLKKTKRVWKATGKLFANVGYQWRPTGKKFSLGKLNCGYQWRPTGKKFALGEQCPLTKLPVKCRTGRPLVSGLRLFKTYDGESFKAQELRRKVHRDRVGIFNQKSVPRTPQQNGVVERRNRILVEATRIMLIFSKAPMFLWAEVVATALFGALCYPTNDSEDLGKLQAKADIGIFIGYAPRRKGFQIYNKRTRRIMETIHVTFDELHQSMAPVHISSGPEPMSMTLGQFSQTVSTTFVQDAPSISYHPSSSGIQPLVISSCSSVGPTIEDNHQLNSSYPFKPSVNPDTGGTRYLAQSSQDVYPVIHQKLYRPLITMTLYYIELSKVKSKNFKMAVIEDCWFQAMQDEIHEFDQLEVWELVPRPVYGHPQKEDQGYVDSGYSRNMTGNMSYLSNFKEFNEGHVTIGG